MICNAKTTIIIPTLNEIQNIAKILDTLMDDGYFIIIADDGSTDGTADIVKDYEKTGSVLLFDHGNFEIKGNAASVMDAFSLAKTEKIIVMDADFQHPIEKIAEIENALDSCDIAVGCRQKIENWSLDRRIISNSAKFLAYAFLFARGSPVCSDQISGFFGFRRTVLEKIDRKKIVKKGIKVLLDMTKQLKSRDVKIVEIPYVFIGRTEGKSKFSAKYIYYFLVSLIG